MEVNREECIIIGGDFNIRIGGEGEIEELKEMKRKSRDKIVSNGGRRFVNWINEIGGYVMNGTTNGDKEGEYTYMGARDCSVIDYNILNESCSD